MSVTVAPIASSNHELSILAMRTLLLALLSVVLTVPLQAQSQTKAFFELTHQIESIPETVEQEAENVAESKRYLREVAPMGDPTALIPGNLHLSIADTPFILYLRSTNHHTEARLESLALDVLDDAIREAKAFLQEVRRRATSRQVCKSS
jgi:hypothetical protein